MCVKQEHFGSSYSGIDFDKVIHYYHPDESTLNFKEFEGISMHKNKKREVMDILSEELNLLNHSDKYLYCTDYYIYMQNFSTPKFELTFFGYRKPDINVIKRICEPYLYSEDKSLPKINLISVSNGTPELTSHSLKSKIEIDLENSYNLSYNINDIISDIKSDRSGLMLFTGLPGTGKSSLIKYLSQENQNIKFCYINNSNLDILSNPSFLNFCLDNLKDCVIVLEDCEKALLTRDLNKGFDISNILNLTDGIIGDLLNIKIIATLNTTDKIDTALLRKGRLISRTDFKRLTIEQGVNMVKSLGIDCKVDSEMQLCEIYNVKNNGITNSAKVSVGF